MERLLTKDLIAWKNSKYRKPLILKGVRQVGKTWLLKDFGETNYDNVAYFNLDENPEYKQFFDTTKDPIRILENLSMASGQKVTKEKTLIIFDEIQECPNALNSLKYFNEKEPLYHVACAGSLLGVALAGSSFPVGMVDFLEIYPMSFTEFLMASNNKNLVDYLDNINFIQTIPDAFFNPLSEKLKMYFVTGGMPEAVKLWTEENDINLVNSALTNILNAYERDFSKHAETTEFPKISYVWKSIPSQLSRENKKFVYSVIKPGARAREYEDALQWLIDANLVYKIFRVSAPRLPLAAYNDLSAFKVYLVDVGLLRKMALLAPTAITEGNRLFTEFKGALSENYILSSLKIQNEGVPHYWSTSNPSYEVDFILQIENDIFPIEVKADQNIESKSLKKFKEEFSEQTKLRVRFSMRNLSIDGDVLNIPLFMADYTNRLIKFAEKGRS